MMERAMIHSTPVLLARQPVTEVFDSYLFEDKYA